MVINVPFCQITGEAPIYFTRGDGAVFRLWRIVKGGAYPGTYTVMQYAPRPKKGAMPIKEWNRLKFQEAKALIHTLLYDVAPVGRQKRATA